ncbi:hypothetical protein P152DRAFT_476982 [Eremomyces bilateralis CBS 781.70]|uniref:Rhodopsin domain-containing protein n=1 Tax=Eremomyces bilateralis CBS 781.70 TaxID=1392243 RepID=A0A6G1FSQ4_9PEZI|nr:uncharacterized protein P152DRAFT_476982 [Eremomyces bilateralis CBS 781.70]KAF1808895.1 hypothetical protein P152DRAFT_476982 [Eremomyces bilateralis CBS 781.70]
MSLQLLLEEDPDKLIALLEYGATFPDYPKNFTLPGLLDPNYVPPNKSRPLEVLCYCLAAISTIVVFLRLWIRKRVKGMMFGWDDWLIIPGQILSLGTIIVMVLLIKKGGSGQHVFDVSYDQIKMLQFLEFIGVMLYFHAIFLIRLSITAFLYRLMGVASMTKRILLHSTVVFLILELIIQVFAFVFACKPISAAWDMDVRLAGFKSINLALEIFVLTVIYLATDVWLLVLPIHTVWSLQLPLWTRIGVTWVFAFGGVACAGAVVKTIYVYPVFHSWDPSWNGIGFQIGAVIELGFGAISASMPAMNHILVKTIPTSLKSWINGKSRSQNPSTANRKTTPVNQSFRDVFSRNGPNVRALKTYDDEPTEVEFDFGWESRRKGTQSQWMEPGYEDLDKQAGRHPMISMRGLPGSQTGRSDASSDSVLPLNKAR